MRNVGLPRIDADDAGTSGLSIWLTAAAIYVAFRAGYDNWRGALRPAEIAT